MASVPPVVPVVSTISLVFLRFVIFFWLWLWDIWFMASLWVSPRVACFFFSAFSFANYAAFWMLFLMKFLFRRTIEVVVGGLLYMGENTLVGLDFLWVDWPRIWSTSPWEMISLVLIFFASLISLCLEVSFPLLLPMREDRSLLVRLLVAVTFLIALWIPSWLSTLT